MNQEVDWERSNIGIALTPRLILLLNNEGYFLMRFGVFADESRYTQGRFRAICAVSLPAESVNEIQAQLTSVLQKTSMTELKWRKLRAPKSISCALQFLDILFHGIDRHKLRADCIIWDTEDRRHLVDNRDDIRNYERMFFHLHRSLMRKRGSSGEWHLRPDEQVQIDWDTIHSCLASPGTWRKDRAQPVLLAEFSDLTHQIRSFRQVESHKQPLCQLADLIAGVAPYTRERASVIRKLLDVDANQGALFDYDGVDVSVRDQARFPIIKKLYENCGKRSMGVSLGTHGYFQTKNPKSPINFWHYAPQHENDVAPRRAENKIPQGSFSG